MIQGCSEYTLHALGFSSQCIDDQFFVFLSPLSYVSVRINEVVDIVDYILPLATLIVKGHTIRCQRLKRQLNVDLWSTCNTNSYVGEW